MLAMHVAASNPIAMDISGVPAETIAREKAILEEKNAGKPANVLEKIVASGLKTYAKENTLLEQAYVHDGAKTVTQAIGEAAKAAGADVKLTAASCACSSEKASKRPLTTSLLKSPRCPATDRQITDERKSGTGAFFS